MASSVLFTSLNTFLNERKQASLCVFPSGFFSVEKNHVSGASASKNHCPRAIGMGSKLVGCGSAVPKLVVSNDDLAKIVDTSDEWISVRTGIHNRRILTGDETLSALALEAANRALQMAKVEAAGIDLIIMCSSTPDDIFGGGPRLQKDLGCKNACAFDIRAACSGFILGVITATRFIKGGGYENILVIGADAPSRFVVDWNDRATCVLFGDAAGAVLLQACNGDEDALFGFDLHTDGSGQKNLHSSVKFNEAELTSNTNGIPLFPPKHLTYPCIQMNGREVFRFAVQRVPQAVKAAMRKSGLTSADVDWLLLHQANQRIIDAAAAQLQFPPEKVISNLAKYGNTSAASIPLALDESVRSGRVKAGDIIATAGFGAGLTWAAAILRWG